MCVMADSPPFHSTICVKPGTAILSGVIPVLISPKPFMALIRFCIRLRETSVLFAALMGSLWLKEGFGWRRVAGAASVVAGIAALRL